MANSQSSSKAAKIIASAGAAALLALCLSGCGGGSSSGNAAGASAYQDGTYIGESSVMDSGVDGDGYGVVSVTISDGKISDVVFEAYQVDGTLKDESYGKGTASYSLAQKVISYVEDYEQALVEAGSAEGVDVISGATYLHDQFVEAADAALEQAKA